MLIIIFVFGVLFFIGRIIMFILKGLRAKKQEDKAAVRKYLTKASNTALIAAVVLSLFAFFGQYLF